MRQLLCAFLASAALLRAEPSGACGPCGSAVDCQHAADICRQDIWNKETSCIKSKCGGACSGWLAELKSKTCSSLTPTESCNGCMLAKCKPELDACGADATGGISCADWLLAGGDPADLTPYAPLQAAFDVEVCVCYGACGPDGSGDCAAACPEDALGYWYLPGLADAACLACQGSACAAELAVCAGE